MSSMQQSFKADQSEGNREEWNRSAMESTNQTRDEVATTTAHASKQEASGFLQQTGEQMMHMAQGAVDTVKNTLGFNDDKSN
ncbi:late embryogenesis abundant protein 1-like [Cucurbita moschata]|uniref:Late embryogenesis abundant protein 1-like n=1 Tax=Cucurbita moschata TaxID=3662 RepID=A0A6J1GH10_CUCMO|nr:late embryogenesis abundant protein 1-like [Cucurbita moschata]